MHLLTMNFPSLAMAVDHIPRSDGLPDVPLRSRLDVRVYTPFFFCALWPKYRFTGLRYFACQN